LWRRVKMGNSMFRFLLGIWLLWVWCEASFDTVTGSILGLFVAMWGLALVLEGVNRVMVFLVGCKEGWERQNGRNKGKGVLWHA